MTLRQLLVVLMARRTIVFFFFFAGAIAAILWALFKEASYEATAELVFSPTAPQILRSSDDQTDVDFLYLKTQIDILSSDRVLQRAVERLNLPKDPKILEQFQRASVKGTIEQYCVGLLKGGLSIIPFKDSRVVKIVFKSPSPKFSANVANAVVEAFVDVNSDLMVTTAKRSAEDFSKHAVELRKELNTAQLRLDNYRKANGVISFENTDDVGMTSLKNFSSEIANARVAAIKAKRDYEGAESALNDTRSTSMTNVIDSAQLRELKIEEGRAALQVQALAQRLGPQHPDYIEQLNRLNSVREQMGVERRSIVSGLRVEAKIAADRVTAMEKELAGQTTTFLSDRSNQDELNALTREVENAKRAYELVLQRFSRATVNSKSEEPNVAILLRAVPPLQITSIISSSNVFVGCILGLVLGIAFAAMVELVDRRIRAPEDIEHWTGVPILSSIPVVQMTTKQKKGVSGFLDSRTVRIAYGSSGTLTSK